MALAAVVTDLIFSTKIIAEARARKRTVKVLRSFSAMEKYLLSTPPDMLIVDLNCGGINGVSAIALAKQTVPPCKVLAYFSHVQAELAQQAGAAGADQVVPRSQFVKLLPDLVKNYADAVVPS